MHHNKLNIALIGYGKMGKIIQKVAQSRGHSIGLIISSSNPDDLNEANLSSIDVAIEFTVPAIAADNLRLLADHKVPTACGTTAWLSEYDQVSALFESNNTGFIYASNFSIGVNILFAINKHLAKIMNTFSTYEVSLIEAHHITKLDAPSGTAVTLADQIIAEVNRKKAWSLDIKNKHTIPITAKREEDKKGVHEISYTSDIDEITIKHEAFSREGFALGAVIAAEYIAKKRKVHTMEDLLKF